MISYYPSCVESFHLQIRTNFPSAKSKSGEFSIELCLVMYKIMKVENNENERVKVCTFTFYDSLL